MNNIDRFVRCKYTSHNVLNINEFAINRNKTALKVVQQYKKRMIMKEIKDKLLVEQGPTKFLTILEVKKNHLTSLRSYQNCLKMHQCNYFW